MQEIKCPYCGTNEYSKKSKLSGVFKDWSSVSSHVSKCKNNTGNYYISSTAGCIYLPEVVHFTDKDFELLYPKLTSANLSAILKKLKLLKLVSSNFTFRRHYTKQEIIKAILHFEKNFGRLPGIRDFSSRNPEYPNHDTVKTYFGTWNAAIEAAGFKPNIQKGYGIDTYGLDGYLYRSQAEAYFADTYLYNKYKYEIEPKYPKPHNRYYDWYVPELNLYIELDGGIRPEVIQKKIEINKSLNRHCVVIPTIKIYDSAHIMRVCCSVSESPCQGESAS